jgi:hypothetical protein
MVRGTEVGSSRRHRWVNIGVQQIPQAAGRDSDPLPARAGPLQKAAQLPSFNTLFLRLAVYASRRSFHKPKTSCLIFQTERCRLRALAWCICTVTPIAAKSHRLWR